MAGKNSAAYAAKWITSSLATVMGRSEARAQFKKDLRHRLHALVRLMKEEWPNLPRNDYKEIVANGFKTLRLLTSVGGYCKLIQKEYPEFLENLTDLIVYNTDSTSIQQEARKIIKNFSAAGYCEFPVELNHYIAKHNLA